MTSDPLTPEQQQAGLEILARLVDRLDWEPPVTLAETEAVLDRLPARRAGETLRQWLDRVAPAEAEPAADPGILPLARARRLRPLTGFERLAAATEDALLALPEGRLESEDGDFVLRAEAVEGGIRLELRAQGAAVIDHAGRILVLLAAEDDTTGLADIPLDAMAAASIVLPDGPALRRALLRPRLALVEEEPDP